MKIKGSPGGCPSADFNRKVPNLKTETLISLLHGIQDEIWFTNTRRRSTLINPGVCQENGSVPPESLKEASAAALEVYRSDGTPLSCAEAPAMRALKGEMVRNQKEITVVPETGEIRYREVSASPLRNKKQAVIGSVSVIRDITEQHRAEEALKRHSAAQAGINRILNGALTYATEEDFANICLEVAQSLTQSQYGLIGEIKEGRLEILAVSPHPWEACRTHKAYKGYLPVCPVLQDILDTAVSQGRAFAVAGVKNASNRKMGQPQTIDRLLVLPLLAGGQNIGVIAVGNRPRAYGAIEEELIESLVPAIVKALLGKRIEKALRKTYEELELRVQERTMELQRQAGLLHLVRDAIALCSMGGKIRFWSQGAADIYGFTKEEAEGKIIYNLLKTRFPIPLDEIEEAVHLTGKWEGELVQTRKDKNVIIVISTWCVEKDEHGRPRAIMHVDFDITAKKRAEEALRTMGAYNRSLIEASPDPLVTIDPQGKITDVNRATEWITGYTRHELIGTDFSNYFTEPEKARTGYQMMFKEEAVSDYELEICHRNGNITPVLYNASVYKDDCGRVIGIFAAARDVSERRRTELALRESEERYRTAIENASDGIALVRDDNVYAYVNRRFAEIFGYLDPNEIIDRPISLTVHEDDRRRVLEANLMSSEGNPVSSRYEFKGVKKDGTVRFIEVSLARTTYRGKAVVLQSLRDVTDYRLLEQELKQSQKMEAIGTLAGGIAHDFNNILAGIIGFSEMILDDVSEDNHPLAHRLELVLKAAERGRDLVRQILAFSRQTSYEAKEVAFARIIDEALHLLRPVLPSTIEIRKRITTYEDAVFADPAQLHQVFMNLCTNAAQAMKSKGGIIEIELSDADALESEAISRPNEKGRTYIKLTVKDTGCGIPDQNMPKIFDPFFTTKGPGEGTGLGLSVVHGIIKNHAGHVRVSSKEGEGTSFQVYLPKSEALKCTEKNVLRKISGGQERILFVDDEETLVELNRERLQRLGYEVVSTTNGPEALDIFRADPHKFDLVITDYTMPQMTGFELASAIVDMRPDLPVILCSGLHDNISYEQAGAPGIRAFISKTSGKQELADLIRKVLSE